MFFLKNIKLINFRCFDSVKFSFSPNINVFVGENATGKTSIVEGISYLFLGKSMKKAKDLDALKRNEQYFSVVGEISSEKEEKIVVSFQENKKKIINNNKPYEKIGDLVVEKALISFVPDDLFIIKGAPAERRRFLDICISQIDKDYLNILMHYKKILKVRNDFIKDNKEKQINYEYLDVLDAVLIKDAKEIIKKRQIFVKNIKENVEKLGSDLSEGKDIIKIHYQGCSDVDCFDEKFKKSLENDLKYETTTFGPHRDDLLIYINKQKASDFSSQGQIRSAVLAMKLGFATYLREIDKDFVVILDDVLSELDENRQNKVFKLIKNKNQTFITCTNLKTISNEILKDSNVIKVGKDDTNE